MQGRGRWRRQGRVVVVRRAQVGLYTGSPLMTEGYGDEGQGAARGTPTEIYQGRSIDPVRTDTYHADSFEGLSMLSSPVLEGYPSSSLTYGAVSVLPFRDTAGRGIRAALRGRGMV